MSCKKIGRVLRNAYKFVDEDMLTVADEVIQVTGKIRMLNNSATIQDIEAALGVSSKVTDWISTGLDKIYDAEVKGKTLAEKIKIALDKTVTELGVNGEVAKIASVAVSVGDARNLPEHVYDQSVSIVVARTKVPD